jgi:hypothetical protein
MLKITEDGDGVNKLRSVILIYRKPIAGQILHGDKN